MIDERYYVRILFTYYDLTNVKHLLEDATKRDLRMPTNEAELQGIIATAIAQYAASHAKTSGNISHNHGNNNPPNGNVKSFEIYYDTFGYL